MYTQEQFVDLNNAFILSPLDFGAKYNGIDDDSQAHEDMFEYLRTLFSDNLKPLVNACSPKYNCIIQLPAGTARLTRALHIPNACVVRGVGGGPGTSSGTCLKFAYGVHGVIIDSVHSSKLLANSPDAAWCVFKDIYILADGDRNDPTTKYKHGLILRTRAHIENVIIENFSGDGFHIVSASDGNVDDANRIWTANSAYTDGDWIKALAHQRQVLSNNSQLNLEANPAGLGVDVIKLTSTTNWVDQIETNDIVLIEGKSAINSMGIENAGIYIVGGTGNPGDTLPVPTTTTVYAIKISDSSYFVDSGDFTNPKSVIVQIASGEEIRVLKRLNNRFVCVESGISHLTPQGNPTKSEYYPNTKNLIENSSLAWKEGLALGNANNWFLQYCRSVGNGRHGFYIQGDVVNAGCAIQCDASVNNVWGVFDNSFLGNTWIACHAATNGHGPYRTSSHGNCYSTFIGCYSEGDQKPSKIYRPATIVGGLHAAGVNGGTGSMIGAHLDGEISFRSGNQSDVITIGDPSGDHFLSLRHPSEILPYYFEMTEKERGSLIQMRGSNFSIATASSNNLGTPYGIASGRYPGRCNFILRSLYLGKNNNYIGYTTDRNFTSIQNGLRGPSLETQTTISTFLKGDRIYSHDPQPGGNEGWIVLQSGTNGEPFEVDYLKTIRVKATGLSQIELTEVITFMDYPGRYVNIENPATTLFEKFQIIEIDPVDKRILTITPFDRNISPNFPNGNNLCIEYAPPVFEPFGHIGAPIISTQVAAPIIEILNYPSYSTHHDLTGKPSQSFGFVKIKSHTTGVAFSIHNPNYSSGFSFCVLCTVQTFESQLTSVIANTKQDPGNYSNIIVTIIGNKKATIDTDVSWTILFP